MWGFLETSLRLPTTGLEPCSFEDTLRPRDEREFSDGRDQRRRL